MKKNQQSLEEGKFYHVYNRGNNGDNLFYNNGNYEFFLLRYDQYLSDYIETYAFCLLPNHFHLLIRVKENALLLEEAKRFLTPSQAFHRLFTSYSKAINKQQHRHGSLFENPFKRIEVNSVDYLSNLVFYIHANPQLHGIIDDFRMYPWSSYERILRNKPSKLHKQDVIEWFNNKENYITYHGQKMELAIIKKLILE